MEKDHHQPDSIATVNIKPEYTPSEIYATSEAPPAYVKNVYASVQVARIIAITVVMCSVILGFFLLASAYVTANASCKQLEQELELLGEVADRFQPPLQPEALIQEAPSQPEHPKSDHLKTEESQSNVKSIENNSISDTSDSEDNDSSDSEEVDNDKKVRFKLPLQLDFDDLAGALIEKNQRSRMNCVVEKKKAEQLVDHQPKTVALPFGLNLTTDPRFERVTGERMAIFCESGTAQRASPNKDHEEESNDDEDQDEETIMIQPVMIPIPQTHFATHMAQQMAPQQMIPQQMIPQQMVHPQMVPQQMVHQQMVPPQMAHHMPQPRPQQIQLQEHIMVQPQQIPQQFRPYPPHPMETMRPPMPHPQMIQQQQQPEQQSNNEFPPNTVLRQIAQQIIAQKIMEAQREREEQQNQESRQQPEVSSEDRTIRFPVSDNMIAQRIPIPEAILSHLNRLPPNREVIVAVEQPNSEEQQPQEGQIQMIQEHRPQEVRVIQEPRTNPSEMNGRQSYARAMPIDIPEPIMKQEQEQEPEAQATEEVRPHYLQPRSVRTRRAVDTLLEKASKRVKRCSCDCSC